MSACVFVVEEGLSVTHYKHHPLYSLYSPPNSLSLPVARFFPPSFPLAKKFSNKDYKDIAVIYKVLLTVCVGGL